MNGEKQTSTIGHRILTVVGIVLCVILIPMLIINCTLLIKSWTSKDEVLHLFFCFLPFAAVLQKMQTLKQEMP